LKLGILVNTDRHRDHVTGIAKAAVSRGHEVIIFVMDDGVKLLSDPGVSSLCRIKGIQMSFCKNSTRVLSVSTEGVSAEIEEGSQYYNAVMNRDADRVIVL
jgi:predicted peroxiredoxin